MQNLMFPVYTGINRVIIDCSSEFYHVPCIHRDKPPHDVIQDFYNQCSLYTQGLINSRHKFFPTVLQLVGICKQNFATVIDLWNDLREKTKSPDKKQLYSITITKLQGAQRWAVKVLTIQIPVHNQISIYTH